MEEEKDVNTNNEVNTDNTQDYINTIEEMKKNTVSKEAYEKLREDNAKLIKQLSTSKPEEVKTEVIPTEKEIQDLRNKLSSGKLNNMQYISTALDLRDAVMKTTGRDCFAPFGKKHIEDKDAKAAQDSANFYRTCLKEANGNEAVFNSLLSSGLYDVNE